MDSVTGPWHWLLNRELRSATSCSLLSSSSLRELEYFMYSSVLSGIVRWLLFARILVGFWWQTKISLRILRFYFIVPHNAMNSLTTMQC